MGDMKEHFNALREYNGMRRDKRLELNISILEKSGLIYSVTSNGTMLFRETGKPKVDFYPSTGRWRIVNRKAMKGGATSFINWYKKQEVAK